MRRPPRTDGPQLDCGYRTPPRRRVPKRGRPKKPGAGVPHQRRVVHHRHPLHITLRMQRHVWQLRSQRCYRILERAFFVAAARADARVAHFSVQHNHIHLLVETPDAATLARTMQGMCIRMAKGLNRLMGRRGAVFADRYHARSLGTPTEVRKALVYILGNARKHATRFGRTCSEGWLDPYSSAPWFGGWATPPAPPAGPVPVVPARTWLLTVGWQRAGGLLSRGEAPAKDPS